MSQSIFNSLFRPLINQPEVTPNGPSSSLPKLPPPRIECIAYDHRY